MRRTTGALACLLTLHLSLLAGDLGCGRHPAPASAAASRTPEAATHPPHHQHDASAAERPGDQPSDSCRTPARANCCEAMASCQVQIAFAEAAALVVTSARGAIVRGLEIAPASSALSPDIPPPKA